MVNEAQFPDLNILSAKAILDEYYPQLEIDEDTFVEKAYYAWKRIGTVHSYLHVYEAEIPDDGIIEIPNNVNAIEAVTSNSYFYSYYINSSEHRSMFFYRDGSLLYNLSELDKPVFQDELYNRLGPFVNYELHGTNILHFDKTLAGSEVCIIYDGVISDEDCNPKINYKEAEAIAYQIAYVEFRRLASMGDKNAANMIQIAKAEADNAISAATIPERLNENLMDQVFNAKTTFDRKSYNKNYKYRK